MLKTFALVLSLSASLTLAGCSTVSNGTSGYAGPSAAASVKSAATARRGVRRAARDAKKAEALVAKLRKRIERDTKRLRGKATAKRRKQLVARVKRNRAALRKASRQLRAARRDRRIAGRQVARAERAADRAANRAKAANARAKRVAERRKTMAERRKIIAERRETRRERIAARRARAAVDGTAGRRSASGLGGLGRSAARDPAFAFASDYGARTDGGWRLPAIPIETMPKRLLRQRVTYRTDRKPGTIVVDTGTRYLYLVEKGGTAMRYGIGVGRQGFAWSGEAHIGWKQAWPKWTPPKEMIERDPKLAKYCADCGGMPGGIANPLGARALYLNQGGVDTLFRLHGTPDWRSIGTAASSGCIRMINQDVIDLYDRARTGAKVVVM